MTPKQYEQMQEDLMGMLLGGGMHSTLVGKVITLGGKPSSDKKEAQEFTKYIVDILKKAEQHRKDSVKKNRK